jgi:alanine racemase
MFGSLRSTVGSRLQSRPTKAVVDLSVIARNYRYLQERAGQAAVLPVVKADAYGHGAVAVAQRLEEEGARRFAVATMEEGIELRRGGVRGEILIMSFSDPADASLHGAYGLVPTLYDLEQARGFASATRALAAPLPVQLKIDTGMGRLGVAPEDLPAVVELLRRARGLALTGTFTQLARADERESSATDIQVARMRECLALLSGSGIDPGLVHVANSAGLLSHPASIFGAVRPGLALYGILPSQAIDPGPLAPALTLETEVIAVKTVPEGTPLGYGGRFVTRRVSSVAVLPIGYHDGVRRSFSGRVSVLLRGEKAPIVGAVSMDLTLIDATDSGARPGERVVLLGRDQERQITAWDLARAADTIPYEIVCGIGPRVARVYAS